MTENNTRTLIKEFHGESKYPSGTTCTVKIELFEDGKLIQTETVGQLNPVVTFNKNYKSLSYAKKKLDQLRDKYLGYEMD
jgi:hypothetical protein